jgi:hypothetical protein
LNKRFEVNGSEWIIWNPWYGMDSWLRLVVWNGEKFGIDAFEWMI